MTLLTELLREVVGGDANLSVGCWIRDAVQYEQDDFRDVIEVVTEHSSRDDFIRRLREEHPLDRPHVDGHDDSLLNVFTEAEAFAWAAEVARLGTPSFVFRPGAPDLHIAPDTWIEAKTIHGSQQDRDEMDRLIAGSASGITMRGPVTLTTPHSGLLNKFDGALADSVKKLGRQKGGRLFVFFDLTTVDFGTSNRRALAQVREWAGEAERQLEAVRIAVAYNYKWRTPPAGPDGRKSGAPPLSRLLLPHGLGGGDHDV